MWAIAAREVQPGGDDDAPGPLEQREVLAHPRHEGLGEVVVRVDQAGDHDPVLVAHDLGAGVRFPELPVGADRGDAVALDQDGAVAQVAGGTHREDVARPHECRGGGVGRHRGFSVREPFPLPATREPHGGFRPSNHPDVRDPRGARRCGSADDFRCWRW